MDFDSVLSDVGECGRYQRLMLCFVLLPAILPCAFHAYSQLFMALVPVHWCFVPELAPLNLSRGARRRLVAPPGDARCRAYDVDYARLGDRPWTPNASWPTAPCRSGWEYGADDGDASSVVADWDLVCDRSLLVPLALSVFAIGGLVGHLVFGRLQDSLGRRPTFFIFLLLLSVFGTATAFATDYVTWVILRFFNGLAVPAIIGTPYVLAMELVGPSKRARTTVITNAVYSLVLVLLSIVASLVRDWHQMALATTVPFVAFFLYWWVLPESPRWLLAHGRFEETEKIVRTIAHVNRCPLPPDYVIALKRRFQAEATLRDRAEVTRCREYGYSDLFRTPNVRKKTVVVTFAWLATSCSYVGLSYLAPSLPGRDPRLSFLAAAVAELPSYALLWPSMQLWGRKWTLCWSLLAAGAACLATLVVRGDDTFVLVLFAVSKMAISVAFTALPLMASELYPTVVRGLGLNFSSLVSMLGPVVIPFVNYLGETTLTVPFLFTGCLLLAAGLSTLSLPETLNQRLPHSLRDAEEMGKEAPLCDPFQCCPRRHAFMIEPSVREGGEDDDVVSEDRSESPLRSLLEQQGILQSLIGSEAEAGSAPADRKQSEKVMVTAF